MKPIHSPGKRKTAIAKATLSKGSGKVFVNRTPLELVQPEQARLRISEPLRLAGDKIKNLNIKVKMIGGGFQSQAEAARLAIARSLVKLDKTLKSTFLNYDRHLLIADVRRKEQRKPNDSKARSKRQKSYR